MRLAPSAFTIVVLGGLVAAAAESGPRERSVTVVLDFDRPHSEVSLGAMERETRAILRGSGLGVDFQLKSELAEHAEFGELVIFKMTGACSMEAYRVLPDERGPLAFAHVADGAVLPFGEVRCDRVRASIERTLPSGAERDDRLLGRALGRVMAHEMYHMVAHARKHTAHGVTRSSLSRYDLTRKELPLDAASRQAMEHPAR